MSHAGGNVLTNDKDNNTSVVTEIVTGGANPILTPAGLASRWGVTVKHLANLRCAKAGPSYVKLRGVVRYRLADVEAYEDRHLVSVAA